jgi:alkylation response protein AidB-like acyl-CoA dehydrogenase
MAMSPRLWPAEVLAPQAQALDTDSPALQRALDDAAAAGMLGLRAPPELGGLGLTGEAFARVQVEMARASGTFAFLQAQHQSALGFVMRSEGAVRTWLPKLATGTVRAGIAYGWLRRPGPPLVTAQVEGAGVRLRGRLPWMTGWGFFSHCVVAARLPDRRVVLAWLDLSQQGVHATPPMRLAAFEAARTVAVKLDVIISEDSVLKVASEDWLERRDPSRAAPQAAFVLGIAWAGLELVARCFPDGDEALLGLRQQVEQVDAAVFSHIQSGEDGHAVRAEAIALAGRLSLAAIAASSGRAALHDHAAQRVHRDLLGFTVLSQTPAVRQATLAALSQS